jgi:hypothetical protein
VIQLAPELPSHENFVFHWKSVTNYFIESTGITKLTLAICNIVISFDKLSQRCFEFLKSEYFGSSDDKVPVQSTNIPHSLEHMLEILRLEDEENGGSTAVCYEISSHKGTLPL